jgi:hypothetical protein
MCSGDFPFTGAQIVPCSGTRRWRLRMNPGDLFLKLGQLAVVLGILSEALTYGRGLLALSALGEIFSGRAEAPLAHLSR